MTAQQLCNWALRLITVLASGESPATEESNDALVTLNAIIGSWNETVERVLKGSFSSVFYTFIPLDSFASLATTSTHTPGVQRALAYALAVDLAGEYGRQVPPDVAATAQSSRAAIMTLPSSPTP